MALRTTAQLRALWGPDCTPNSELVGFRFCGQVVWVHKLIVPALRQLDLVFRTHYYPVRSAGSFNCRKITGGVGLSLHAFGICIDINPDTNPYRTDKLVTDMSRELVQDAKNIMTRKGVRVWRWGGDFNDNNERDDRVYDAMHWECVASPAELAAGFEDQFYPTRQISLWPTLALGSFGSAVKHLQTELAPYTQSPLVVDGQFGSKTDEAVRIYQGMHGLVADGIVGPQTWTGLATDQYEPARVGAPLPDKGILSDLSRQGAI